MMRRDMGETREVAAEHSELVEQLTLLAERARRELGDGDRLGSARAAAELRAAGYAVPRISPLDNP